MDTTRIKEKIRKLLNLAEDDGAMEGEINNALNFARRLMLQHNISEEDIKQKGYLKCQLNWNLLNNDFFITFKYQFFV